MFLIDITSCNVLYEGDIELLKVMEMMKVL